MPKPILCLLLPLSQNNKKGFASKRRRDSSELDKGEKKRTL